jgi:hypothetical protein
MVEARGHFMLPNCHSLFGDYFPGLLCSCGWRDARSKKVLANLNESASPVYFLFLLQCWVAVGCRTSCAIRGGIHRYIRGFFERKGLYVALRLTVLTDHQFSCYNPSTLVAFFGATLETFAPAAL